MTIAARFDPTHPLRWARIRAAGKGTFIVNTGVLAIGIPLALIANLLVLWARGDLDLWISASNAFELTFTMLLVAPLLGALAGEALWARGERRTGELNGDVASAPAVALFVPTEADEEQRRLSSLKAELDALARTSPRRLIWRVLGFTLLGYGYVLLVIGALIAGAWLLPRLNGALGEVTRLASQMMFGFAFVLLTALWVRLLEPKGRPITRTGSPALFEALDKIRDTLKAPAPDVVVLNGELNASVAEIPRFGIFGLPRRYLAIGLPLLESLPADECVAILAHEMAHLSRRHGRRLVWVGRLSISWQGLAVALEGGRHWGRTLFLPFFRWYAPRFELLAQAVSRCDEYEADSLAAECVGADAMGRALLRLELSQRFLLEVVLPSVNRESADRLEPSRGAFDRMGEMLHAGPARSDIERWARAVLAQRTLDDHTHPSLGDRLARLETASGGHGDMDGDGERAVAAAIASLSGTGAASGAEELLGRHRLAKLRSQVEEDWLSATNRRWRRWHADAQIWRQYADGDRSAEPSFEALWAHARWATDCESPRAALPIIREVLRRDPDHVEATVYLGRLLADSSELVEQEEGLGLLEQVLRRDSMLALFACALLEAQYARRGRRDDVERVRTYERHLKARALVAVRERRELRASDHMSPYVIPAPMLGALRKACEARLDVTRAYLVQKRTQYFRDQPCLMLAFERKAPWYRLSDDSTAVETGQALLKRVTLPETADLFVLPVHPRTRLRRRLRAIPGAEIYRR